jgi:ACS family glucarate transporter-like MFS transporter
MSGAEEKTLTTKPSERDAAVVPYQSVHARPSHMRYGVMIFLGALAFLTYFDRVCIAWAGEFIQKDLKMSDAQMGYVLGAFWLAYAIFEIPGGWLADRFGARRALGRIVIAWSVFTALSGCATGFMSLYLYRFLFGVGEAGAYPSMARVQSKWLPVQSRAWFGGVLWMLSRWGAAFSPVIFGAMMAVFRREGFRHLVQHVPGLHWLAAVPVWRLGFLAAGLMGVVWVTFFLPWFRDNPAEKKGVNEAELNLIKHGREARDSEHHHVEGVFLQLFTSKPMWIVATIGILMSYCFSFYVSWLPKYLKQVHHLDLQQSKWLGVMPMFCAGIACLVTGYFSDWFVRKTGKKWLGRAFFPMTGMVLAAASLMVLRMKWTPGQATIILCVAAFAMDMNQSCHWANIVDIGGKYAALAFGFMNMLGNIGNWVGPSINERLFNTWGWGSLFAVNAVVFLITAVVWIFNDPCKRFYKDGTVGEMGPVVE